MFSKHVGEGCRVNFNLDVPSSPDNTWCSISATLVAFERHFLCLCDSIVDGWNIQLEDLSLSKQFAHLGRASK